eukprot:s247_g4.t1
MPSKKVMKVAMKKPASKKKQMKKPLSKKHEMKKPATSALVSGENRTKGRSEFLSTVYRNSREAPIGGLIPDVCEAAHAGVPASEALRETWKSAIKKTYTEKVAEDWTSEDCIQGSPSCLHVHKPLHTFYDNNNMKEDDKTSMVAFLPAKMLHKVPSPKESNDDFCAYILARGSAAREVVSDFILSACRKHGLSEVGMNRCRVGTEKEPFITIFRNEPEDLARAAKNLKEKEFNYEEEAKLVLHKKSVGETEADYNCIAKGTVLGEVKKLASLGDCPIVWAKPTGDRVLSPQWLSDGTAKYIAVHIRGKEHCHWFNLRMRAVRLLRHRYLGSLQNGGDDETCSQDISGSEEEILRMAPVAWELSSVALKECTLEGHGRVIRFLMLRISHDFAGDRRGSGLQELEALQSQLDARISQVMEEDCRDIPSGPPTRQDTKHVPTPAPPLPRGADLASSHWFKELEASWAAGAAAAKPPAPRAPMPPAATAAAARPAAQAELTLEPMVEPVTKSGGVEGLVLTPTYFHFRSDE